MSGGNFLKVFKITFYLIYIQVVVKHNIQDMSILQINSMILGFYFIKYPNSTPKIVFY